MKKKYLGYKLSYIKAIFIYLFSFTFLKKKKKFTYSGIKLNYFDHKYNLTWLNERRVEIPVVKYELNLEKGKMLEVGNVLSHYGINGQDIVDKYEKGLNNLMNVDILEFNPIYKYDFITSISTIEHIGLDEGEDPHKAIRAILHLKTILNPNGKMFISFPIGYNQVLDEWIFSKNHFFFSIVFLVRCNIFNEWIEVDESAVKKVKFNSPYPLGNAVAFCKYHVK